MKGHYNKNQNYNISNDNIFNVSGQNIMSNSKSIETILNENRSLKSEINKTNKEIENARKRLNIIEREIERLRKQNNNNYKNRGRSVGIRNNTNVNNNNNYGYIGGMFNESDPFNDSFFQFPD